VINARCPPSRRDPRRRCSGLFAADGRDEEGTLERLKALRRELVDPKIAEHNGRLVKTTGDGLLVEFASVVDAVRCAAEVQRGMLDREPDLPDERRIRLRIGINLGDVIADGEDVFGDGVNVTARLEALAEPGGICVSRVVRDAGAWDSAWWSMPRLSVRRSGGAARRPPGPSRVARQHEYP
jgi:class 3 adenylate cyclase